MVSPCQASPDMHLMRTPCQTSGSAAAMLKDESARTISTRIPDPLNQALVHCRWNATVGMNPIFSIVKSTRIAPRAGDTSPSKSVSIISVWIRSSSPSPSFLSVTYDMRFTAAPPSTTLQKICWSMMIEFRHISLKNRHKTVSMTISNNVMYWASQITPRDVP